MPDRAAIARSRADALAACFARIAATRMADVPIVRPGFGVHAVGFAPHGDGGALGVLLTPWFMNLVWLPLEAPDEAPPVGTTRSRVAGPWSFDFLAAHEAEFGPFEACSLFSPVFEFADEAAALATAQAVLDELRRAPEPAAPSRRALLFGRGAAGAAA